MRRRELLGGLAACGGVLAVSGRRAMGSAGGTRGSDDPYEPLGSVFVSGSAEAVVGDGGEVAYVAVGNGFATVGISDPADPSILAEVRGISTPFGDLEGIADVKVAGDRLLVVGPARGGSPSGFLLYDVSDPANPEPATEFFETSHSIHNGFLHEEYAYLTDNDTLGKPLRIYDVSGDEPEPVAGWSLWDYDPPDVEGWSEMLFLPATLHDVYVHDGVAYLACWDAGTWMVDVSDPANPSYLNRVGDYSLERLVEVGNDREEYVRLYREAPGNAHYVTVDGDANLMAVGGEAWDSPEVSGEGPAGIDLWNVSDPSSPEKLSTIRPESAPDTSRDGVWTTAHNFDLHRGRLYSAWYQAGVKVHDVYDPTDPRLIAWWREPREASFWTAQIAVPGEFFVASTYGSESPDGGSLYAFPDEAGQQEDPPVLREGTTAGTTATRATASGSTSAAGSPGTRRTSTRTTAAGSGTPAPTDPGESGVESVDGASGSAPGFGVLAGVAGLGVGAYRYLRRGGDRRDDRGHGD